MTTRRIVPALVWALGGAGCDLGATSNCDGDSDCTAWCTPPPEPEGPCRQCFFECGGGGDCEYVPDVLPDGTECDDGLACTTNDRCEDGECEGGGALCQNPGNCEQLPAQCSEPGGDCEYAIADDGAECDDGDACTLDDECFGGSCYGEPMECLPPGECQEEGFCSKGECVYPPVSDGTPCNDTLECTVMDACEGGLCAGTVTCEFPPAATCADAITVLACEAPGECDATGFCEYGCDEYPCPGGFVCVGGGCELDLEPFGPVGVWMEDSYPGGCTVSVARLDAEPVAPVSLGSAECILYGPRGTLYAEAAAGETNCVVAFDGAGGEVLVASSDDGCLTFGSPLDVTGGSSSDEEFAAVGLGSGGTVVLWNDWEDTSLHAAVAGSGTSSVLSDSYGYYPDVEVSGSTVLATWNAPGDGGLVVARSDDGGATFDPWVLVSGLLGVSGEPDIEFGDGGDVVIAFSGDSDTFVAHSGDDGASWDAPVELSGGSDIGPRVSTASDGDTIFVAWDGWYDDVFLARSVDGGASWDPAVNLSGGVSNTLAPRVSVEGSSVVAVWASDSPGEFDVFATMSADGGDSFSAPVNVSDTAIPSGPARVTRYAGEVLVGWTELEAEGVKLPDDAEIFLARSSDGGATFGAPEALTDTVPASVNLEMIAP